MRCTSPIRVALVSVTFTAAAAMLTHGAAPAAAPAPFGWRGDGTGRYADARPPVTWSASQHVVWKTPMPGGSAASPVLAGDRLFVLCEPANLYCLRAADGEILWQRGHAPADLDDSALARLAGDLPKFNPDGNAGTTSSTPVCDGKSVYAIFANGIASAHTLDGRRRWVRFIERPKTGYGHCASPLLIDGKLVVHFIDVVALDAATGNEVWRVKLPSSHASPVAARVGDVDLVIHPAGAVIRAADGKVLGRGFFHMTESSPLVQDGVIYAHENGRIKAYALPDTVGDSIDLKLLWQTDAPRAGYQIPSPVVAGGTLYSVSMAGIFQATDCKTGRQVYRQRLPLQSRLYASVTLAGDHLYVADQTGRTLVIDPGDQFKLAATNDLDLHPSSHVFAGNRMYLRTWRQVICVERPQ